MLRAVSTMFLLTSLVITLYGLGPLPATGGSSPSPHPSPAHTALCRQEHLKLDKYQLIIASASVNESDEQEADRNILLKAVEVPIR